jgi:hypothetical protein
VNSIYKQFEIFRSVYSTGKLKESVGRSKVESIKKLDHVGEIRLLILRDLIRTHIDSFDSNTQEYLENGNCLFFKDPTNAPLGAHLFFKSYYLMIDK